ncbi:hypothetical protein Hanom_Chr00s055447g01782551 [Helianthus anomalus]
MVPATLFQPVQSRVSQFRLVSVQIRFNLALVRVQFRFRPESVGLFVVSWLGFSRTKSTVASVSFVSGFASQPAQVRIWFHSIQVSFV